MKEINGIVYADESINPIVIVSVKALQDRMLLIKFNTGEWKLFDTTMLQGEAFTGLDDESIFANPVIENNVVTWDNGNIDCAPEYMYEYGYTYNKQDILTA